MLEGKDVAIFALLYGPHHDLHKRLIESLDPHGVKTICSVWCNQVVPETIEMLSKRPWIQTIVSSENVPKYHVMRQMFELVKNSSHIKWVCWFDDDSYVTTSDWLDWMLHFIDERTIENVCYIGQPWFVHHLPGQEKFISESAWYHGKPSEIIRGRPGVNFATGGYFWLRVDLIKRLDWPDPRLRMNGGDTLLGEAIRQLGLPFHRCDRGVRVNEAPRRGISEAPAGCIDTGARR